MRLSAKNTARTWSCDDAAHVHTATCCSRRAFLGGLTAAAFAAPAFSQEKPFRIDTHHHLSSPGFVAEIAGRRTGQTPLIQWSVQKSLDDMDKGGVATSILSISEPGVFFGNYDAARALARECNEFGAKTIADHKGRFEIGRAHV